MKKPDILYQEEFRPLLTFLFGMVLMIEVIRFFYLKEGSMIHFILRGISAPSVLTLFALIYISPYFGGKKILGLTSIAGLAVGILVIHIFINRLDIASSTSLACFIVFLSLLVGGFSGARLISPKLYDQICYTLAILLIFVIGLFVGFGIGYILYLIGIPNSISTPLGLVIGTSMALIYGSQKIIESHKISTLSSFPEKEVYHPIGAGFTIASIVIFLGIGFRWLSNTIFEVMNIGPTIAYKWIIIYELIVIATGFIFGYVVGYLSQIILKDIRNKN